jgi:membrane fusion protein (multidrug efflux system)
MSPIACKTGFVSMSMTQDNAPREQGDLRSRGAPEGAVENRKSGRQEGGEQPARQSAQIQSEKPPRVSWRQRIRRHPYAVGASVIALIVLLAAAFVWWLHARRYESTDDAFIDTRTVPVSSQVAGAITAVPVTDNQLVGPGTVLVSIDPRDYQSAVAQAKAQVDQATAAVANLDAQIEEQSARVEQARRQVMQTQAALEFARQESGRAQELVTRGAGTQQQAQQTASNLRQAEANLAGAQANAEAAEKQVAVLRTQRGSAEAQLEQAQAAQVQAQTNLARAQIVAPTEGRATKISAAIGAYAQPGQVLMMFVPQEVWVTANYKETQLTSMRPGQPVDIRVDAYPGRRFDGHVDSIQAGSGAAFALLPPENATGNYVKVVQRVPVKIVFDKVPDVYLGPGMSVVPTVQVR